MGKLMILVGILAACFISLAIVSAACDDDNQIILRVNSNYNAHAALWNQSYSIKVCYDSFFSPKYTGTNPHDCSSASNKVLSLYRETNSHAADKDSSSYPISVCHGGLTNCEIVSGQCPVGKTAIVYLSNTNNAHLSTSASPYYPYAVCCKGQGTTPPPQPTRCADYSSQITFPEYYGQGNCTKDIFNVAKSSDPLCTHLSGETCYCEWGDNKCNLATNRTTPDGKCQYKCVKEMTDYATAQCIEGFKNVTLKATIVPISGCTTTPTDANCVSTSIPIPCGLEMAELPFFGAWQFVAVLVGVFAIYLIASRRKN